MNLLVDCVEDIPLHIGRGRRQCVCVFSRTCADDPGWFGVVFGPGGIVFSSKGDRGGNHCDECQCIGVAIQCVDFYQMWVGGGCVVHIESHSPDIGVAGGGGWGRHRIFVGEELGKKSSMIVS